LEKDEVKDLERQVMKVSGQLEELTDIIQQLKG